MSILDTAAQLFLDKIGAQGSDLSTSNVMSALQNLLPTDGGEIDLSALISRFTSQGGGLSQIASTWLAKGENAGISTEQITQVLGQGNISDFASRLGIDTGTAANGLSQALPQVIDQFTSESMGGKLMDAAKGIFDKIR